MLKMPTCVVGNVYHIIVFQICEYVMFCDVMSIVLLNILTNLLKMYVMSIVLIVFDKSGHTVVGVM